MVVLVLSWQWVALALAIVIAVALFVHGGYENAREMKDRLITSDTQARFSTIAKGYASDVLEHKDSLGTVEKERLENLEKKSSEHIVLSENMKNAAGKWANRTWLGPIAVYKFNKRRLEIINGNNTEVTV